MKNITSQSRRSGTGHTVLPANYTVPAFTSYSFTRWRLPTLQIEVADSCSLLLIYLPRKDERLLAWLAALYRTVYPHKWCKSRA